MARGRLLAQARQLRKELDKELDAGARMDFFFVFENEDGTYRHGDETLTQAQLDKHLKKSEERYAAGEGYFYTIIL